MEATGNTRQVRASGAQDWKLLVTQLGQPGSLLHEIARQLPSGLIVAAPDGRILFTNAEAERLLRHSMGVPESYREYPTHYGGIHPDGSPLSPEEYPMSRAIRDGQVIHSEEFYYRRGDGTTTTLLLNAAPIRNHSGSVIAGVVGFIDIGERKAAEEALRFSEERYRGLVNADARIVFVADSEGRLIEPRETGAVHPDDRGRLSEAWAEGIRSTAPFTCEYRMSQGGGYEWREVCLRAVPLMATAGGVREWVGTISDVSESRRAERLLQAREEEFRTILASVPDVVSRHGPDLRYEYISPAIERATGLPTSHFIGRRHAEAGIPPSLARRFDDVLAEVFHSAAEQTMTFSFRSPGGETRHYHVSAVPEMGRAAVWYPC